MEPVWAAAEIAVEQLTGCPVRKNSLRGDIALVTMTLNCSGSSDVARPEPPEFECTGSATEFGTSSADLDVTITCGPKDW